MADHQLEQVLVVPTAVFHRIGHFQGFSPDVDRYLGELLEPANVSYRPRQEMEQDPSFKQLIPYVVFRHCDSTGRDQLFQYTRGRGQGEGRLHSKRSIGVGGHISTLDQHVGELGSAIYAEGLRRELAEEVTVDSPFVERCVGLINDDDSEVGRVHLGVVHIFDVARPRVTPLEADMIETGFRDVDALLADLNDFETWSQICLRSLWK